MRRSARLSIAPRVPGAVQPLADVLETNGLRAQGHGDHLVVSVEGSPTGRRRPASIALAFDAGIVLVELSVATHHAGRSLPLTRRRRCAMTRIIKAELMRLVRRRTILVSLAAALAVRGRHHADGVRLGEVDRHRPTRGAAEPRWPSLGRQRRCHTGLRRRRIVRRLPGLRHVHRDDRSRVLGRHLSGSAAPRPAPAATDRRQGDRVVDRRSRRGGSSGDLLDRRCRSSSRRPKTFDIVHLVVGRRSTPCGA